MFVLFLLLPFVASFKAPPSSPVAVDTPSPPPFNGYYCLSIPVDARALGAFIEGSSLGKSILFCPQKFVCVNEKSAQPLEDTTQTSFCTKNNYSTVVMPPWLIPSLDALVTPREQFSDTRVDIMCDQSAHITLGDGTRIDSSLTLKSIETADGTRIQIPSVGGARIEAIDGIECLLAYNWSSVTRFKDKTSVHISNNKTVDISTSDDTTLKVSLNGLSLSLADNTTVLCSEYGMVVITADGKETFIPVDSSGLGKSRLCGHSPRGVSFYSTAKH